MIERTRPGRRRRYTAQEKRQILDEAEAPGSSMSARRYGIAPSLLSRWRRLEDEGALPSLGADEHVVPESKVRNLEHQVRELQRLLGKKTLENEILKDALELTRSKKLISPGSSPRRGGTR
ncbi:MAG: transposase [Deltaproteobacteria bacterium]|nr:transposase [Deltaproteobacteria bacterium]